MPDTDSNNQLLSQLMKKSSLKMPFSDFEENTMHRFHKEIRQKQVLSRDRKLAFFFFLLGSTLGLVINSLLQQLRYRFLGISAETILLIFQISFVLLFLTQLENFIKLFVRLKKYSG